mmetsp:Transcript_8948/g.26981  ORF Transcript_8948/g.26981 Transcript_8948/m.26981 type:complete len:202 (+) Transcript_8948:280-885(+)
MPWTALAAGAPTSKRLPDMAATAAPYSDAAPLGPGHTVQSLTSTAPPPLPRSKMYTAPSDSEFPDPTLPPLPSAPTASSGMPSPSMSSSIASEYPNLSLGCRAALTPRSRLSLTVPSASRKRIQASPERSEFMLPPTASSAVPSPFKSVKAAREVANTPPVGMVSMPLPDSMRRCEVTLTDALTDAGQPPVVSTSRMKTVP